MKLREVKVGSRTPNSFNIPSRLLYCSVERYRVKRTFRLEVISNTSMVMFRLPDILNSELTELAWKETLVYVRATYK